MKQKLKEKDVHVFHRRKLVDQFPNLRQVASNVNEYMSHFEEIILWCDILEDSWNTTTQFFNGQNESLRRLF